MIRRVPSRPAGFTSVLAIVAPLAAFACQVLSCQSIADTPPGDAKPEAGEDMAKATDLVGANDLVDRRSIDDLSGAGAEDAVDVAPETDADGAAGDAQTLGACDVSSITEETVTSDPCDATVGWCSANPLFRNGAPNADIWSPAPGVAWALSSDGWLDRLTDTDRSILRKGGIGVRTSAMWGAAEDDVWVVGPGHLEHFDGCNWKSGWLETLPDVPQDLKLTGVSGTASDSVWVISEYGLVLNWNGNNWHHENVPFNVYFSDVWADPSGDVWIAAQDLYSGERLAVILRRHEGCWQQVTLPEEIPLGGGLTTVAGTPEGDVWFAGPYTTWPADVWTVDNPSETASTPVVPIIRYHDGAFEAVAAPTGLGNPCYVAASASGAVWLTDGSGSPYRWNGMTWDAVPNEWGFSLGTLAPSDDWGFWAMVHDGEPTRWDGTTWTVPHIPAHTYRAMATDVDDTLWAVGDEGLVARLEEGQWVRHHAGTLHTLLAVWASDNGMWAVGDAGTVIYHTVTGWQTLPPAGPDDLTSVWASGPDDVWATGETGYVPYGLPVEGVTRLLHWDGDLWSEIPTPNTMPLRSVAGTPAGDLYISGDDGVIWKRDGDTWAAVETGISPHSFSEVRWLRCDRAGRLWAAGNTGWPEGAFNQGLIARLDDEGWTHWQIEHGESINAVWSDGSSRAVALGYNSGIYTLEGGVWQLFKPEIMDVLHAVGGSPEGEAWVLGGSGLTYHKVLQ